MKKRFIILFLLAYPLFLINKAAGSDWQKAFSFEHKDDLKEWKEKAFHGRVLYEVRTDPQSKKGCLFADSNRNSSGIFHKINYKPKNYPYVSWKWKAAKFPSKTAVEKDTRKSWIERDDYALRVYIIFPSIFFTNTKCLEYIWSEDLPKGAVLTSPFYKNIKIIVLESGNKNLGQWVTEERNIVNDYRLAFGGWPGLNVGAIAIMTDSDNTQSSAQGYYADIKVGYSRAIFSHAEYKQVGEEGPASREGFREFFRRLKSWLMKLKTRISEKPKQEVRDEKDK